MSGSPFRIGQRVVIVQSSSPHMLGVVTRVASALEPVGSHNVYPPGTLVHDLEVASIHPGKIVAYRPEHLAPYEPDDRVPAEWTEDLRRLCGRKEPVST